MGFLQKVRSGEPFSLKAPTFNEFVEAANRSKKDPAQNETISRADQTLIRIKNESSEDVPAFGILDITGVLITPVDDLKTFQSQPVFKGDTPSDESQKYVIVLSGIKAGTIGKAILPGKLAVCKIDSDDADPEEEFAATKSGSASALEVSDSGLARILYRESGTGEKWAVVSLGGSGGGNDCKTNAFIIIAVEGIVSGGTVTITVGYTGTDDEFYSFPIEIDWNESAASFLTKIQGLSHMPGGLTANGSLPANDLVIKAGFSIGMSTSFEAHNLEGDWARPRITVIS